MSVKGLSIFNIFFSLLFSINDGDEAKVKKKKKRSNFIIDKNV